MKKLSALLLSLVIACLCSIGICADDTVPSAYVTISDADGNLVLTYEEIPYYDYDKDGTNTINDILAIAHISKYPGGINGYASEDSVYGLSMTKLWGAQTGAYGYYVNNASPASLLDPIGNGDHIQAFVYTDTIGFSDTFCFFDTVSMICAANDTVTLTLCALTYDENWNTVSIPVVNAEILVNNEPIDVHTDENGKASFVMKAGRNIIVSARSDDMTLVAPVCKITTSNGSSLLIILIIVAAAIVAAAIVAVAIVTFVTIKKYIATRKNLK